MLATRGQDLKGKTCLVSGSGNVAQYTVEKLLQLGARVLTLSDSSGHIYDEQGITPRSWTSSWPSRTSAAAASRSTPTPTRG